MGLLHIKQINLKEADQYRVVVTLRFADAAEPPEEATVDFAFRMTEDDQKDLRGYLEDYLQYPLDPNPQIAARIEERMAALGVAVPQMAQVATALNRRLDSRFDFLTQGEAEEALAVPLA